MIYEDNFKMGLKDIGKYNLMKDRSMLEMFENIGAYHSDIVGYGANDVKKTKVVWILFDWKLKVIKRPKYGQNIHIKTWGRDMQKAYTYRDFELYDEQNNLCAIATSKWAIVNYDSGKLVRITDEIANSYGVEEKSVFENRKIEKINLPNTYTNTYNYTVSRRDIDINGHMHNLYYLDLAYEALPQEIYEKRPYNNVTINYKKEIRIGEVVKCKYGLIDNKHVVAIYSEDEKKLHAIIELN